MADRSRRARPRQISEVTDDFSEQSASESERDWDPRKSDSARRAGKNESPIATVSARSKRGGDDKQQSIRLTMKVAPSKLREVTRANEVDSLQDTLGGGRVIDGPRSRRAAATSARSSARGAGRPRYAEYGESDLEEDDQDDEEDEEQEDDEEDREDEEGEEVTNGFDEVGAEVGDSSEEEEEDDEEEEDEEEEDEEEDDVEMEDAPPLPPPKRQPPQPKPPRITLKPPPKAAEAKQGAKTKITITPAQVGPLKSVEDQEMEDDAEDDEGDEESSELSEDEEVTNLNQDAEGEEEPLEEEDAEGEDEELDDDEDMDDDSGDETPASGMATPDPNRLTKRQRGRPEDQGQLMALDMAPQQRKFFTDEEKAMKKDEHARKRKELTKRKILEEKTAALNRLLKPQASKARGAVPKPETLAAATAAAAVEEEDLTERANPLYTRWVSTKDGIRLGVPQEWLGKHVGQVFEPSLTPRNGALVQEL